MQRFILVAALPMAAVFALLQGCNESTECPEATTTVVHESVPTFVDGEETYDCINIERAGAAQQSWCEAQAQFDESGLSHSDQAFRSFLYGYRNGVSHARQGKDSLLVRSQADDNKGNPEEAGYHAGYQTVLTNLGLHEFDCASGENASEYKDRWCEASDAFRSSGLGGDNPFVMDRFINGYMSGGRVALTVPTSMESFFSGENPEGKQPSIIQPEGELSGAELAFYRGYDDGYKAMIASIRESINQVMQQMQMPENMELPEGLMPPQMPGAGQ